MHLSDLAAFVDSHALLRWLARLAVLVGTGAAALAPLWAPRGSRFRRPWLLLALFAATLFVCRAPTLFYPEPYNPDEGQMISQAITARHHPIPWKDFDGNTGGPVNTYAALWSVPFGLSPSFTTARCGSLLCALSLLGFLYFAGRRIAGDLATRIGLLPLLLFFAFSTAPDFIHYSSEQFTLFLMGGALYLLVRLRREGGAGIVVLLGILLGLVPFAKLQGMMMAGFLAFLGLTVLAWRDRRAPARAAGRMALLLLACAAPGAAILAVVAHFGGFGEFWHSYILMSRAYSFTAASPWSGLLERLYVVLSLFFPGSPMAAPVYLLGLLPCAVSIPLFLSGRLRATRTALAGWLAALLLLLVATASIVVTACLFPHYQYYLLFPLGLLTLFHLRIARTAIRAGPPADLADPAKRLAIAAFALAGIVLLLVPLRHHYAFVLFTHTAAYAIAFVPLSVAGIASLKISRTLASGRPLGRGGAAKALFAVLFLAPALALAPQENRYAGQIAAFRSTPRSEAELAILTVRPPGGRIAIWGWIPEVAVKTETPMGTRFAVSQFVIGLMDQRNVFHITPLTEYLRANFLADMKENRPELFLDATGPASFVFTDHELYGIHIYPDLERFVSEEYRLYREVDGMRLYVRRDLPTP